MKKLLFVYIVGLFSSLYCELNLQMGIHWESPVRCAEDCTKNQMAFLKYPLKVESIKTNDNEVKIPHHILGSYWGVTLSKINFQRPKNISFKPYNDMTASYDYVRLRRAVITGGVYGNDCSIKFGKENATSWEGVFCYQWVKHGRSRKIGDNEQFFKTNNALRGGMFLSSANFKPLLGIPMNTSDYFGESIYVPLHFITPGMYVINSSKDFEVGSKLSSDLNTVLKKQNNYVAIYSDGTSSENPSVKVSDSIGF